MRTLMKISIPVKSGNEAIKTGGLPRVMTSTIQDLKPEAAYFYPENGRRAALMVFDMRDSSQMPVIAERFFMELEADVTFTPVMNADDLKKGLEQVAGAVAARV